MKVYALVAAIIAWYFGAKAWRQPRLAVIVATILWLLYAVWEYLIVIEVLCDAKCNIRIDLLLIWPALLIATLFACRSPGQWTRAGKLLRAIGFGILALVLALFGYIFLVES